MLKVIVIVGVILNIAFMLLALLDVPSIAVIFAIWIGIGLTYHKGKIDKVKNTN